MGSLSTAEAFPDTTFCFFRDVNAGTEHSLGDEQDAALHSLPVLPYSKPLSTGVRVVLRVQWESSGRAS